MKEGDIMNVPFLKRAYESAQLTKHNIWVAVQKRYIAREDYKVVTGEDYPEEAAEKPAE